MTEEGTPEEVDEKRVVKFSVEDVLGYIMKLYGYELVSYLAQVNLLHPDKKSYVGPSAVSVMRSLDGFYLPCSTCRRKVKYEDATFTLFHKLHTLPRKHLAGSFLIVILCQKCSSLLDQDRLRSKYRVPRLKVSSKTPRIVYRKQEEEPDQTEEEIIEESMEQPEEESEEQHDDQ